jgi:pyruvate dehydrogenase E2 component (dihydrolipoyllysine-residue acetyltransferase)
VAEVKDVVVPDIGDFTDVPIIEVLVGPGDEVAAEDPLVTLESDKATMDVPAPFGGVVQELRVEVGDTVSEGSTLLTLEAGSNGAAPAASTETPGAGPPQEQPEPVEAIVAEEAAPVDEDAGSVEEAESPSDVHSPGDGPAYASPGVRRLARELEVDLRGIDGSGRKGRILKSDVEAAARDDGAPGRAPTAPATGVGGLELAPWPTVDFEKFGPIERQPLSRIKRISGPVLARNWVMIPHVTHHDEADVTELEAFRKEMNAELADRGVKLTMVALLVKASVAALKAFPEFNASLDGGDLVLKRYYNVGFAADTPNGLVVPVIKEADAKGLAEIAGDLATLSKTARDGKLGPADMSGATFTISSLGGIGGTGFTPIINAPEVAILGATRSAIRPVWDGSAFVPRLMLPLSLSYDHRVVDGAAAARFCAHLVKVLSDFRRVLL